MRRTLLCCAVVLPLCLGCDGPPTPVADAGPKRKMDEILSASKVSSAEPVPTERKKPSWKEIPPITVDQLGAYIGGYRASKLDTPEGKHKLKELCSYIPFDKVDKKRPTVVADTKVHTSDVVETVWALGVAGAPEVLIKTKGRGELPDELVVVPQSRVTKADDCSLCSMVTEKADTGVWALKGGGGKRARKGFAGPDLSNTEEFMRKHLQGCDSDKAFFTAAYNLNWEHAYNIGALIRYVDEDKKIKSVVLLGEVPVAGRAVKLRK